MDSLLVLKGLMLLTCPAPVGPAQPTCEAWIPQASTHQYTAIGAQKRNVATAVDMSNKTALTVVPQRSRRKASPKAMSSPTVMPKDFNSHYLIFSSKNIDLAGDPAIKISFPRPDRIYIGRSVSVKRSELLNHEKDELLDTTAADEIPIAETTILRYQDSPTLKLQNAGGQVVLTSVPIKGGWAAIIINAQPGDPCAPPSGGVAHQHDQFNKMLRRHADQQMPDFKLTGYSESEVHYLPIPQETADLNLPEEVVGLTCKDVPNFERSGKSRVFPNLPLKLLTTSPDTCGESCKECPPPCDNCKKDATAPAKSNGRKKLP